jgi:hypothetical protein
MFGFAGGLRDGLLHEQSTGQWGGENREKIDFLWFCVNLNRPRALASIAGQAHLFSMHRI